MKLTWFLCYLFISSFVSAQPLLLIDSFVSPTPIDSWTIDGQYNLLVASENNIQKKAMNGERKFNQTFKNLGSIQSISPINAMKILLFSDIQQSVAIVDNTLTQQGNILDLSELGFSNVVFICASNRPNLIWVFDQFRSSLNLVDFQKSQILQSIQNVEGKDASILELKEYKDHLYVLFSDGTLNSYDFLLNFIGSYSLVNCQKFDFWNDQIVCLTENTSSLRFVPISIRSGQKIPDWQIGSPISSFMIQGEVLGIQNGAIISLFSIK